MIVQHQKFKSMEDFFCFYQITFNENAVLNKRYQILKRFGEYLEKEQLLDADPMDGYVWKKQRDLLIKSYHDILKSPSLKSTQILRQSGCASCQQRCM